MGRPPRKAELRAANLDAKAIGSAISRFKRRMAEVRAFDANALVTRSDGQLEGLNTRLAESLAQTYGPDTYEYARHVPYFRVSDGPYNMMYEVPKAEWAPAINVSRDELIGRMEALISSLKEQLADIDGDQAPAPSAPAKGDLGRNVFIVHGQDHAAKNDVARTLAQLGLNPIILHEQPSKGATLIEKLEANASCEFAVVLLTPDDEGRQRGVNDWNLRARQNVILELGYFLAKLGRTKVCALYVDGVEIPSDYSGVVYHVLDQSRAWRFQLGQELRAAGFKIDLNKLS